VHDPAAALDLSTPLQVALARLQRSGEMLAGAIGGPLVVGALTPQRNAMTLAAMDGTSSFAGVYRQVFRQGFLPSFRGGSRVTLAAVPQFTAIGPVFLAVERRWGSPAAAMLVASVAESLCSFSAQRRNAQIQYNATRSCASEMLALHQPHRLVGPGFVPHVGRNVFAVMGIRLFSPHSYEVVCRLPGAERMSEGGRLVAADLASSVAAATLSMPFNHIFSWSACTPALDGMSYWGRAKASAHWIFNTYQQQGSKLLARDLAIRINYTAYLFTGYRIVERTLVSLSEF